MAEKAKYGLQLVGTTRVFSKEKEIKGKGKKSFTITDVWFNVSEKEENGYLNKPINLFFGKDKEKPDNNTVITIYESFPIITGTGKWERVSYFVKSWDYAEGYNG